MAITIHWFRRDLRLYDNVALHFAQQSGFKVKPIFIFDENILSQLPTKDQRVSFIHREVLKLKKQLLTIHSDIEIHYGDPLTIFKKLVGENEIEQVYANHDYEPYARKRDEAIKSFLATKNIRFHTFKDHVIFEKTQILTNNNSPYKKYTPYKNSWKSLLLPKDLKTFKIELQPDFWVNFNAEKVFSLKELGFEETNIPKVALSIGDIAVSDYDNTRDLPFLKESTSKLGAALRFGLVSIREVVEYAKKTNEVFLDELIWREFFIQILWNYPHVVKGAFKEKYNEISWRNNEKEFELWCKGQTGFPLVDAGMRELNATGFMHNRVRMLTASFLVKHLLIDWRWGEAYFAEKLMDFELASNNGNWQWVAGTGTDSAPYFRIFNPETQQKKFDPNLKYIKKWIPEYGTSKYPHAIVEHKNSRERALMTYKKVL